MIFQNILTLLINVVVVIDTRRGNCYLEYRQGRCSNALAMQISKSSCCCMDDDTPKGWGPRCELCPRKGDALYSQLCRGTTGKESMVESKYMCTCKSILLSEFLLILEKRKENELFYFQMWMNVCFIPISVKMEPVKIYKELTDVFVIKDLHQIPTERSV